MSSPDSRHSRNLAERPGVAITLFDSAAPIGGAEALYADAVAELVSDAACPEALELVNERLPAGQRLVPDDLAPAGPFALYEARISQHYVLVRGGDPRLDDVADRAVRVDL